MHVCNKQKLYFAAKLPLSAPRKGNLSNQMARFAKVR